MKMMPRQLFRQKFSMIVVLLFLMSMPKEVVEKTRGISVAMLAPSWEYLHTLKLKILGGIAFKVESALPTERQDKQLELELQNQFLLQENDRLRALLLQNSHLLGRLSAIEATEQPLQPHKLHPHHLERLLEQQLVATPAKIIFRSPSSWGSSLWINLGASNSQIVKNSPVVLGDALLGVIDYIGENQSRVRLITDSGLVPSVRATREIAGKTWYLAKGELQGSSQPLWRSEGQILKGIGFNYDFADEEGMARDLRTGEAIDPKDHTPAIPIIQEGDALITTGMDGLFPVGLRVATVLKIFPLKEGDYYFELEAKPAVNRLDELNFVFVLPAVGYNPADLPPFY